MTVYADTSVLIAWFHPADLFARVVTEWRRTRSVEFSWNPLLRVELRHNLRRLSGRYAAIAWHAYSMAESSGRLCSDRHRLTDLLAWGDELSARFTGHTTCGTWDCVHVAASQRSGAEAFATCDPPQAELARLSGIENVFLFRQR